MGYSLITHASVHLLFARNLFPVLGQIHWNPLVLGPGCILSACRWRGKFSDTCPSPLSTLLTVSNGLCCSHSLVPIEFMSPSLIGNDMCFPGQLPLTWAESQVFLKNYYGTLCILTYLTLYDRCILGEDGFMGELLALKAQDLSLILRNHIGGGGVGK